MMPPSRFDTRAYGHSGAEQKSIRPQGNEAEAKGLRTVKHPRGYENIENGIVLGSAKGTIPISIPSNAPNPPEHLCHSELNAFKRLPFLWQAIGGSCSISAAV